MKLIKQTSKLFLAFTLVMILTITNTRGVLAETIHVNSSYTYLAQASTDLGDQVKANLKKAQGKAQETYGNITGDREAQIEGKVNQASVSNSFNSRRF